jgi:selenide, water dikinase
METKRLTEYADCAGCASKLGPAELDAVMHGLPTAHVDDRVLVDFSTADDAGVYRWSDDSALVQTVDFFTPMVDDPYIFGRIAAANALSDVYAMGGLPKTALAIASLPKGQDSPSPDVVREIFRGGSDTLRDASVALLGGHTVTDPEVKFGYAVTGEVHPDRIWRNVGAKPGDVLVLTKPLGTGIIVRATKFGRSTTEQLSAAVASMTSLNKTAAQVGIAAETGTISACTDVTGFGLAGHSTEIALGSGVTIVLDARKLPLLPGVSDLAVQNLPCGGRSNQRHYDRLAVETGVPHELFLVCCDPQTSGGLLFVVASDRADNFVAAQRAAGVPATPVGVVEHRSPDGTLVRLR